MIELKNEACAIIKNHLEHIRQIDELNEIAETIEDMYYRIKRIREKEVSQ